MNEKENRIEIYLDENAEPVASYSPPAKFELDTSTLDDGPHRLRIVALDRYDHRGVREVSFEVRNGPGIAVDGLHDGDIVEGKIGILINAYGGAYEEKWEPTSAETPKPVPTWAWVAFIIVVAWAMYYAVQQWRPTPQFAQTPTYGKIAEVEQEKAEKGSAMGADLYRTSCASCHQNNGQGLPNVFPPLAGNPVVIAADPTEHVKVVLFGKKGGKINGISYRAEMPAWADQLSDEEVAAVINHERTSWGNHAPTVTAEEVGSIRRR